MSDGERRLANDLVIEIEEEGEITRFAYAPDGTRFRQERAGRTTYYVGADFEYVVDRTGPALAIEKRTYVEDFLVIERAQGQRRLRYLHPDRLGSLAAITDQSGEAIARHTFAPFGRPLAGDGTDTGGRLHDGEVATATTPRGFTGHEHLDAHRLIHMGGRVFDPGLGRFLSVEPFIQNLASSQSLNPYSYVLNSPFSATGPHRLRLPAHRQRQPVLHRQRRQHHRPAHPHRHHQRAPRPERRSRQDRPRGSTDALERGAIAVAGALGRAAGFTWVVLEGFFSGGIDTAAGLAHMVAHPS